MEAALHWWSCNTNRKVFHYVFLFPALFVKIHSEIIWNKVYQWPKVICASLIESLFSDKTKINTSSTIKMEFPSTSVHVYGKYWVTHGELCHSHLKPVFDCNDTSVNVAVKPLQYIYNPVENHHNSQKISGELVVNFTFIKSEKTYTTQQKV